MTAKQINRTIRVFRLLAVVQASHHSTMMQMNRQLLQCDNSWQRAEHLSHWMSVLMPYHDCSPTDFLHDKDEVSDTVLDNYSEFKKWIKIAEKAGISEKTLTAFCKNVDNLQSVFRLKAFGHIFYPEWLNALLLYVNDVIAKAELRKILVEYSLFTGKARPADLAEFRKTVLEIEKTVSQIAHKQACRAMNT
jgi:hypothetical protein